jgi:hypothetical protein
MLSGEDSSKQIVDILERANLNEELLKKRFYDIRPEGATTATSKIGDK